MSVDEWTEWKVEWFQVFIQIQGFACDKEEMEKGQAQMHRKSRIRWTGLFAGEAIATQMLKVFIIYG